MATSRLYQNRINVKHLEVMSLPFQTTDEPVILLSGPKGPGEQPMRTLVDPIKRKASPQERFAYDIAINQ